MTQHLNSFENRVKEIQTGLKLDSPFVVEDADKYQEFTKAFILLIHAELEKYFETISMQMVSDGFKTFQENGKMSKPLLALLSSETYHCIVPSRFSDEENKQDEKMDDRIAHFVKAFKNNILVKNNGIKGKDIFKMLWTLGFSKEDVGEELIIRLDKYGTKRGGLAHRGRIGTTTSLNYVNEIKEVEEIKTELIKFDSLVEQSGYLRPETTISEIEAMLYKQDDKNEDEDK